MITAQMAAWQPSFTARTREKESEFLESTVNEVMYFYLREDEKERHRRIVEETENYYMELVKELSV